MLTILLLVGMSFPHSNCKAATGKEVPVPGFIIRKAGDTLQTQILIDTSSFFYLIRGTESVSYLGSDGAAKVARPNDILGYGFFLNSNKHLWLTRKFRMGNVSSLNDENRFLHAIVVGKVSLFKWWVASSSSATHGNSDFDRMNNKVKFDADFSALWVYEKEGMAMKGIDVFGFKKRLRALIEDCPTILAKSEEKKYNRKNFQPLIEEYNATCK